MSSMQKDNLAQLPDLIEKELHSLLQVIDAKIDAKD